MILRDHKNLEDHLSKLKRNPSIISAKDIEKIQDRQLRNLKLAKQIQVKQIGEQPLSTPKSCRQGIKWSLEAVLVNEPAVFMKNVVIHFMDQLPAVEEFQNLVRSNNSGSKYDTLMQHFAAVKKGATPLLPGKTMFKICMLSKKIRKLVMDRLKPLTLLDLFKFHELVEGIRHFMTKPDLGYIS